MSGASAERRSLLAKVHIAKAQLALDDSTYRVLLKRVTGQDSSAKATDDGLVRVIEELKLKGWKDKPGARRARGADERPQAAKLRALWISLWQLGEVEHRDDGALAAFVMRHTGMQALRWNTVADLNKAIECLKGWCQRIGYEPEPFTSSALPRLELEGSYLPGLIHAQWGRLEKLGAFRTWGRLDTWLRSQGWHVAAPEFLTEDQAQFAVRELGQWIRRVRRNRRPEETDGAA